MLYGVTSLKAPKGAEERRRYAVLLKRWVFHRRYSRKTLISLLSAYIHLTSSLEVGLSSAFVYTALGTDDCTLEG